MSALADWGLWAMKLANSSTGRKRGAKGSHRGKNGGGGGSGTAVCMEGRTTDLGVLGAVVTAFAALGECETRVGRQQGGGDGVRTPF